MSKILAHSRRFQADALAVLADSQLDGSTNDTTLGCTLRLAFTYKEAAVRTESIAAFVADEAVVVPLTADGIDDDIVENVLLAPHAAGCGTPRMAVETPGKAVSLYEGSSRVEGLQG